MDQVKREGEWGYVMRAIIFDHELRYIENWPVPTLKAGWALIRVSLAGICKTDLEILKGYMGFRGVLGHEFLGIVTACEERSWIGKRVTGEINAACGHCDWCARGLGRHCPNRTTLGIDKLDGCMAEFCILPMENLCPIDASIEDERAVLIEPLSAACEILEQLPLHGSERIVVLGDGRLGILCAWVLSTVASDVTLVGHHPEKLDVARWRTIRVVDREDGVIPGADVVVEATGSGRGIALAMSLCRPRGVLVLKSTVALQGEVNLAPIVVHELTVIGSRCGRFADGMAVMMEFPDMPLQRLITDRLPLSSALEAFRRAQDGLSLKVLLDMDL
jgi:alcohol dehydrogenase